MKSKLVTFLLSIFLGGWGAHRFYTGKIGTGVLWLLTGGLCGIGLIYDWICIAKGTYLDATGQPLQNDLDSKICWIVYGIYLAIILGSLLLFGGSILLMVAVMLGMG